MRHSLPYEKYLNPSQLEAVLYTESPLLVLAGAGSGKTRVITFKITYLIQEWGLKPQNILAVTFTNKASDEMKERVRSLLGEDLDIWIKTFHATCAKILRIMGSHFGIASGFSIIDEHDQIGIIRKIMRDLNFDPETFLPEKYVNLINRAKDRLLNASEALSEKFSVDPLFYDIYQAYEEVLLRGNLLDFGDLIFKIARGLDQNSEALNLLKKRFRYILIDEFQDTNHAQYEVVKKLTFPEGNICVVGDDDQSIYGFRGAKVENILNFPRDYENTRIIKLEENYRSYQTILTASSLLIDKNRDRLGKTMYTRKGMGEKILFHRAYTDYGEAHYIAGKIKGLFANEGYNYSDMAVFYRTNAQSRVLETVFSQDNIPYAIIGGRRFYEREEIKDVLSYVRLAINPMDEVALRRIITKPPRGIGEKTLDTIIKSTIEKGLPFYHITDGSGISNSRLEQLKVLGEFIQDLKQRIDSTSPPDFLRFLYDQSGYISWLEKEGEEERINNLEELFNAVEEFSKRNPDSPISEFVEEVSLNLGTSNEEFQNNRVFLITLHNAKGLEFPVVFIAGMEEGIFPHILSGDNLNDIQEERRLCYVGMTRAMERLFLTAAKVRRLYGRSIERGVSNFIHELPGNLVTFTEDGEIEYEDRLYYDKFKQKEIAFYRSMRGAAPDQSSFTKKILKDMPVLEVNSRVIHEKFGRGRVLEVHDETVIIQFDDGKVMRFLLRFTPITKE